MAEKPTLDGFYPRRPTSHREIGGMGFNEPHQDMDSRRQITARPQDYQPPRPAPVKQEGHVPGIAPEGQGHNGLQRSELEESLRSIDQDDAANYPQDDKKNRRKNKGPRKQRSKRKRIILIVAAVLGAIILGIGIYTAVKLFLAGGSVFKGDLFGIVQQRALKQDANGRTNVLVFGTSEDDEGGDHPGAYLTDSIMLLSIDQNKKDAYMVGIPRDLWIEYGQSCYYGGSEGKINGLFQCYSDMGKDEAAGSSALMKAVAEVTGLEVQYYAHVNYGVVRDSVNAVGGIDITIPDYDSNAPGIYDPNFDWKCNHTCKMVNYKDGEQVHMDGEHALAFARARNAEGGYGLPHGNYDREKNQQLVLLALRNKAMSAGTLSNFVAVTNLMDALGNNLRTNFETAEIRTLMALGSDIKPDAIHSIDLNKDGDNATTTGTGPDGSSIVRPLGGLYDYSSIIKYIRKQISAEPYMLEDAMTIVLNGSGVANQGRAASDKLSDMGFTMALPANAPAGEYARREVYARDASAYPATRAKLASLYGTVNTAGFDKYTVPATVDFIVVVGKADSVTE